MDARIMNVTEQASGVRGLLARLAKRQHGAVPGLMRLLLADFAVMTPTLWLYHHLHERKSSPLTLLQREMLATVVNGLVGGAP